MDALTPLLRAFYTGAISPEERASIHARLLQGLRDLACLAAAADHIDSVTKATEASPDPFALHYALHAVEVAARTSFAATPPPQRARLLALLLDFLVSAYARNAAAAPHGPTIPAHAVHKAAAAAVQLGLREWVSDSTHAFPRAVLALIDQNGHSADSLPRIFAGMALVTGLVDAAVDTSRKDMRSVDRATLTRLVRGVADGVVAALEIGIRINGPRFPRHVAVNAVRAVASLVRVEPAVAADAVAVLKRCVQGRCDRLGAETVGVLAELFGEGKVKMPADWESTLAHAAALLEPVAMGDTARGDGDDVGMFRMRLAAYAEAVTRRVVAMGVQTSALERILNALMGATVRWSHESPDEFSAVLDAWLNILEAFEDAEVEADALLENVCSAVSDLCVRRCMLHTNGKVLEHLQRPEQASFTTRGKEGDGFGAIFEWDEAAELMAEVASDPISFSTMLFVSGHGSEEGIPVEELDDDLISCSRAAYVGKCVEALLACARMSPERVGGAVAEFAGGVLRVKGQAVLSAPSVSNEDLEDLITATYISYCIVPILPSDSPKIQAIFGLLCELVKARAWRKDSAFGIFLFRATASLTRVLTTAPSDSVQNIGASLTLAANEAITSTNCPEKLASAGTLLILSLDKFCRQTLFTAGPPIELAVISSTGHRSVAALGVAAMTRWAIVPERDSKTSLPVKWNAEEWFARQSVFRALCENVLSPFASACALGERIGNAEAVRAIARGAGLLKTIVMSVYSIQGNTGDTLWHGVGKDMSRACVKALVALKTQVISEKSNLDDDAKRVMCGVMGCIVGAIGSLLQVSRRQVAAEASGLAVETIGIVLQVARSQGSIRLGRAALKLIRDQLSSGAPNLLAPGIELAVQTLERGGDQEVAVAAVGVLSEALKRHWQEFWPGDVAHGGPGQTEVSQATAAEPVQRLYFLALQGVLRGVRSADLAVCRAGLLGLQGLDAARRLYGRDAAFRGAGAADAVVLECARVAGAGGDAGRESLGDEAVEVVWGIAKVDLGRFYGATMPGVVREIGGMTEVQGRELVDSFGKVADRPGFVRAFAAFANDLVYLRGLNSGPTL